VPLGNAPEGDVNRGLASLPNAAAVRTRIWAPRLDDRFVPQGVAAGGGWLWVIAYQSTDQRPRSGPCMVFRVDPVRGLTDGQFRLPGSCTLPGGVAWGGDDTLYVAEADRMYRIDTRAALAAGECVDLGCATIPFGGQVRGPALAIRGDALWLAETTLEFDGPARIYRFSLPALRRLPSGTEITEALADRGLPIAAATRGVAVAADGRLWLAQSDNRTGRLQRVDEASGRVLAEFPLIAGTGDVDFGPDGLLWAVSDSGSWRSLPWAPYYPLLFSIDPTALH
jgi:sugar lactone lactonase YvrE